MGKDDAEDLVYTNNHLQGDSATGILLNIAARFRWPFAVFFITVSGGKNIKGCRNECIRLFAAVRGFSYDASSVGYDTDHGIWADKI